MHRIFKKVLTILSRKQKIQMVGLALIMLIGGVMESFSVSLIMPLVTAIMNEDTWNEKWYVQKICGMFGINNHREFIIFLILALVLVFLFKNMYLAWEFYVQYSFATKCKYNMQYTLLRDYLRKPYVFFLSSNTGEIVRIINGDTVQAFSVLENMLTFFTEIVVCIALGITILVMSPMISVGIMLILVLEVLLIAKIIRPKMIKFGEVQREESAVAYQWMLQALDGIKTIRVGKNEEYFLGKYAKHFSKANDIDRIYNTLKNMPRLIIEAFTIDAVLLAMMLMIMNGIEMTSLIPVLSAFVLAAMRLLPSINRISLVVNQLPFLEGGLDNIIEIVDSRDKTEYSNTEVEQGEETNISFKNSLRLNNLSFNYPDSDRLVLNNANLVIKPRESIGLIGASGGGKTTTVDIILGLLNAKSGAVEVDGVNIRSNINEWLRHVAYIPQQIFLIDATIMENIALGVEKENIDVDRVLAVIKEAQLENLIDSLPDGIYTSIGEQGVRISGGQRQRIGIARALYTDAEILFFDEATSALDNETEEAIMESIESLKDKKTMVIIAHRLSTLRNCDKVYKVEEGKISEVENFEA